LAIAYGLEGEVDAAERAYQESLRQALAAEYHSLAAHTTMVAAQGRTYYGQLRQAAEMYRSIIDMGGQRLFFPAGQGYVGLADIHLEWLDLDQAERYLQQGIELCRQGGLAGEISGRIIKSRLLQAQGDLESALAEVQALKYTDGAAMIAATFRQVQISRTLGETDNLAHWAMLLTTVLNGQLSPFPLPVLVTESIQAILIRIYLAQGEVTSALTMLEQLHSTAGPGQRHGRLIEVHLLRALALQQAEDDMAALDQFEKALTLAEPEGYMLLFAEEGPEVTQLLQALLNGPNLSASLARYAQVLLSLPTSDGKSIAKPKTQTAMPEGELIEPLTKRELEILELIGAGYSNREIAGRLVITLNTVKKHSSNIYAKLGVNSRTQAVAVARQLNLL
jgi:LuxR family maltose regulon positive regulatory protein